METIDGQMCKTCIFERLEVDPSGCEECSSCPRANPTLLNVTEDVYPSPGEDCNSFVQNIQVDEKNDRKSGRDLIGKIPISVATVSLIVVFSMYFSGTLNKPRALSTVIISTLFFLASVAFSFVMKIWK